jgi:hypothetical protein
VEHPAADPVAQSSGPARRRRSRPPWRSTSRNKAYATEVARPSSTPRRGSSPKVSPPSSPPIRATPSSSTGREASSLGEGRSPSSHHATAATTSTCRLPSTVASPAPTRSMTWCHSTRSQAKNTPAAAATRRVRPGSGPCRRSSRRASRASTGRASRQRPTAAVEGGTPARATRGPDQAMQRAPIRATSTGLLPIRVSTLCPSTSAPDTSWHCAVVLTGVRFYARDGTRSSLRSQHACRS